MARRLRCSDAGYVYHVLNRAVGRSTIFEKASDYAAFEKVLRQAWERMGTRLLAYALMPNHWHLVVWPQHDGELSTYAQWLTVAGGLIARSDLIGSTLTGMFIPGIGPTAFDVANVEGIEARMPAGLQQSALANLALGGLLVANPAGVPSIAAFPLAGYFDGLPLYDPDVPPPSNVDFESVSPFETSSMGRASYEGGEGAGATAGPVQAPAAPAAGPTSFDSSLDWFFSEAVG